MKSISLWHFQFDNGKCQSADWLYDLDATERLYIHMQLKKLIKGNFQNCEWVREKVREFKIQRGPGYRIYFIQIVDRIIMLRGGTKRTQDRDIEKATEDSIECEELQDGYTKIVSHRLNKRLKEYRE